MNKIFTKISCVALGIVLGSLSLSGQNAAKIQTKGENSVFNSMRMLEKQFTPQQEFPFRNGENKLPEVLPDSIITYSSAGEKEEKVVCSTEYEGWYDVYIWDKNNRISFYFRLLKIFL